jgi:hypothetical protein
MKRCLALVAGIGLLGLWSENAFAQSAPSGASAPVFNPFASFSLSRFSFNTLGFVQVDASSQAATTSSSSASGGGMEEDGAPQAVVVRPPFRPPVRSPYRPPPRPPF